MALAFVGGGAGAVGDGRYVNHGGRSRPDGSFASRGVLRAIGVAGTLAGPSGRGAKVAVLDTGIDLNHPDMGGKVAEGDTAVSLVTGVTVQDVDGHGTHTAGTIAGPARSVSGIRYGVAPDVQLLVGKVFNNQARPSATDEALGRVDELASRLPRRRP